MIFKTVIEDSLIAAALFTIAQLFLQYTSIIDINIIVWQLKFFAPAMIIFAIGNIALAFPSFWIFRSIRAEFDAFGDSFRYTPRALRSKTRSLLLRYYVIGCAPAAIIGASCSLCAIWATHHLWPDHFIGFEMLNTNKLIINILIGIGLLIFSLHDQRDAHAIYLAS